MHRVPLCLLLAGCGRGHGDIEDGLYLRTMFRVGMGLDISTLLFGPGNRVVDNADGGVDPFDVSKANPKSVGTYKVVGDKVEIQWGGGRAPQTLPLERKDGNLVAWDGGIVSRAGKYGKDEKFDATYSGSISAGGGAVSASHDLTFHKDGSFRMDSTGAIATEVTSGLSSKTRQGMYTLSGNTLTLKFSDGETKRYTVLPFDTALAGTQAKMEDDRMILEHMSLRRVK